MTMMTMMNLNDLLHPDCVNVPLEHDDKKLAIEELVDLLADHYDLDDPDAIKKAVWEREQIRTTGIGQGLAIPHCKASPCHDRLLVAIGKPLHPLDYGSIDNQPVNLIILLASPPDRTSEHIQILAGISRLMLNEDFRNAAYAATTADELYELFSQSQPTKAPTA